MGVGVRSARMGGVFSSASKSKQRSKHWSWSGPPGEHSPYPTDPAPYPGYPLKYCFLDIMAGYRVMEERVNFGPTAVTTNVEEFMHELSACYTEGYNINAFVRVPGLSTTVEVDWSMETPYQAIMSRPDKTFSETPNTYELTVVKKILSTKLMHFDCFDDENSLLVGIKRHAEKGGRLMCATPVGYLQSNTSNLQYGAIGVELFFNMPKESYTKQNYSYHALKLSEKFQITLDPTQTIQQIVCETDYTYQLKLFLERGWKLVDICMDTIALAQAFKMKSRICYIDTLWIFEKEQIHLDDDTPRYEGVVIEYLHKVKNTLHGDYPCKDWRPVIAGMGVMGWELATILQTPAIVQSTFTNYTIKLLMLFQRRLIPSFESYRSLKKQNLGDQQNGVGPLKKGDKGDVFRAKGQNEETTGYYNSTLRKYVYQENLEEAAHTSKKSKNQAFQVSNNVTHSTMSQGPQTAQIIPASRLDANSVT